MTGTCGRCGLQDRADRFIDRPLIDLEAEAKQDGRPYDGPVFGAGLRCRDRIACSERARRQPELAEEWT